MFRYLLPEAKKNSFSNEKLHKVYASLVDHVYLQAYTALLASFFCAGILFAAFYDHDKNNSPLFIWATIFLAITIGRTLLAYMYKTSKNPEKYIQAWKRSYILGAALGGASWGLAGVLLFPEASGPQQDLIILMLAGVTSGAVPLSAAVPASAIVFLGFSLVPFIIYLLFTDERILFLFNFALTIYFFYMIILALRTYRLIRNSIILKYENDLLLHNLEITNQKLELAATHDPLTLFANRRLFETNLEKAINHAKENKNILALFYIDLDNFKSINDIYGHHMGDELLITLSNRLTNFFHTKDIIARLGGDELAIIIENCTTKEEIEAIAQKICSLIAEPIYIQNTTLQTSASIGICLYPYDGVDEETLLRQSDHLMYLAKKSGGNRYFFQETKRPAGEIK